MTKNEVNMAESLSRRGIELYKENPFVVGMSTKVRKITSKRGDMALISNDGEVLNNVAGFWEAREVDNTKFIKLFVQGVKALAELTNSGTRVFELMYNEMQQNIGKDQIYLSYTGVDSFLISERTFRRGISELLQKKFIASATAIGWYWVNPSYIWNGDRLAFVKEYRKKGTQPPDVLYREKLEESGQLRIDEN